LAYYFDEKLIFSYWQRRDAMTKDEELEYWRQIQLVIGGVINTHHLYRYGDSDDLKSIAIEAVIAALERFDPYKVLKSGKKPSLFNFISMTAKNSIIYNTLKDAPHRYIESYDAMIENGYDVTTTHIDKDNSELKEQLYHLIQTTKMINHTRKKFRRLTDIMIDYLEYENTEPTKRKLYTYIYTQGKFSPTMIRQYTIFLVRYSSVVKGFIH